MYLCLLSSVLFFRHCPEYRDILEAALDSVLVDYPMLRKCLGLELFDIRIAAQWDKGSAIAWILQAVGLDGNSKDVSLPLSLSLSVSPLSLCLSRSVSLAAVSFCLSLRVSVGASSPAVNPPRCLFLSLPVSVWLQELPHPVSLFLGASSVSFSLR